ncbi:MAG: glycerate kinase [Rhodoferax sp.]|nr:glycerate kinase [Rhodoferax sp.]
MARTGVVIALCGVGVLGYRAYGAPGLALVAGGVVMWVLLQWSRMLHTLNRTAQRPIGTVGSAVMLNARLHAGMRLLQVLAISGSLGQQESPADTEPEVYQWTDGAGSVVRCVFARGRLTQWQLTRQATAPP